MSLRRRLRFAAPGEHNRVAARRYRSVATGDLLLRVEERFLPLRQPSCGAAHSEEHREHLDGNAQGLIDETAVEVHVGVEPARHEVLVFERDLLQLPSHVEKWRGAGDINHLIRHLLDHLRPWVVVLVDAVTEAHEPLLPRLHALDELWDTIQPPNPPH